MIENVKVLLFRFYMKVTNAKRSEIFSVIARQSPVRKLPYEVNEWAQKNSTVLLKIDLYV